MAMAQLTQIGMLLAFIVIICSILCMFAVYVGMCLLFVVVMLVYVCCMFICTNTYSMYYSILSYHQLQPFQLTALRADPMRVGGGSNPPPRKQPANGQIFKPLPTKKINVGNRINLIIRHKVVLISYEMMMFIKRFLP